LQAVPNSRLLLLAPPTRRVEASLRAALDACGIDRQRVKLHPRCTSAVYLQLLGQADVALDPFPFNGHTTTCDALWQGVPVVSLAGNCYAARFGSSALRVLGLEDLIATSPAQYIEVSAQLARDAGRLAELRGQLRLRMQNSVLVDGQRFARRVEHTYFEMRSRWSASS
jgi:predicted O-linked N-acetylglucosamine transferase (SPINDLY family)